MPRDLGGLRGGGRRSRASSVAPVAEQPVEGVRAAQVAVELVLPREADGAVGLLRLRARDLGRLARRCTWRPSASQRRPSTPLPRRPGAGADHDRGVRARQPVLERLERRRSACPYCMRSTRVGDGVGHHLPGDADQLARERPAPDARPRRPSAAVVASIQAIVGGADRGPDGAPSVAVEPADRETGQPRRHCRYAVDGDRPRRRCPGDPAGRRRRRDRRRRSCSRAGPGRGRPGGRRPPPARRRARPAAARGRRLATAMSPLTSNRCGALASTGRRRRTSSQPSSASLGERRGVVARRARDASDVRSMSSMSASSGRSQVIVVLVPRHPEHALGDERALDLLRAAVDRRRPAEQVLAAQPVQLVVEVERGTDVLADRVPRRRLGVDQEQLVDRHLGPERLLAGEALGRCRGCAGAAPPSTRRRGRSAPRGGRRARAMRERLLEPLVEPPLLRSSPRRRAPTGACTWRPPSPGRARRSRDRRGRRRRRGRSRRSGSRRPRRGSGAPRRRPGRGRRAPSSGPCGPARRSGRAAPTAAPGGRTSTTPSARTGGSRRRRVPCRVRREARSLPASGSENAWAHMSSPRSRPGSSASARCGANTSSTGTRISSVVNGSGIWMSGSHSVWNMAARNAGRRRARRPRSGQPSRDQPSSKSSALQPGEVGGAVLEVSAPDSRCTARRAGRCAGTRRARPP